MYCYPLFGKYERNFHFNLGGIHICLDQCFFVRDIVEIYCFTQNVRLFFPSTEWASLSRTDTMVIFLEHLAGRVTVQFKVPKSSVGKNPVCSLSFCLFVSMKKLCDEKRWGNRGWWPWKVPLSTCTLQITQHASKEKLTGFEILYTVLRKMWIGYVDKKLPLQ